MNSECTVEGRLFRAEPSRPSCFGCAGYHMHADASLCIQLGPCRKNMRPDKQDIVWKEIRDSPRTNKG